MRTVFINCPFDPEYRPLLDAILFVLKLANIQPILSSVEIDSARSRIAKIVTQIQDADGSIHDLSRCRSSVADEFSRMNMPFELGIAYALRTTSNGAKPMLIFENERYETQKALSDLSGSDMEPHGADQLNLIRSLRNWLISNGSPIKKGPSAIYGEYLSFDAFRYDRLCGNGFDDDDREHLSVFETIQIMDEFLINSP